MRRPREPNPPGPARQRSSAAPRTAPAPCAIAAASAPDFAAARIHIPLICIRPGHTNAGSGQQRLFIDLSPRERSARHRSGHPVQQAVVHPTAVTETGRNGLTRTAAWPLMPPDWACRAARGVSSCAPPRGGHTKNAPGGNPETKPDEQCSKMGTDSRPRCQSLPTRPGACRVPGPNPTDEPRTSSRKTRPPSWRSGL